MKSTLKKIAAYNVSVQKSIRREYDHYKLRRKIAHLNKLQGSNELSRQQKDEISAYYNSLGVKKISTSWHRFYTACNGIFSEKYIPESLFYLILEPKLNRYDFAPALSDKNLLDRLFPNVKQPETVVKNSHGLYYHNGEIIKMEAVTTLCNNAGKMIIKPAINSYGGKNVLLFQCSEGITDYKGKTLEHLFADYTMDFIVQKFVIQHPSLECLNKTSVNTFRVVTLLTAEKCQVLTMMVRMGRNGAINDNITTGGLSCGVKKDGQLNKVGYDLTGNKFTETDFGIKFSDISFPYMPKVEKAAIMLHKLAPQFRIISWDMAIDPSEEVILIEYNIYGQDINALQLHNGPVFAELLKELL